MPPTWAIPPARTALATGVGSGIGDLRGWAAGFALVAVLAAVAWWSTRRGHR